MRRFAAPLLAFSLLPLAGCGGGPPVTPVEGTLAFASKKPPGNLLLQFHPTAATGGKPLSGSATTDDGGKFRVTCDDGSDGLPAGRYVVTVIDNNLSTEDEPGTAPKGKKPPPNRVGMKYMSADEKTNPLVLSVEAGKSGYELKLD
jgi:hypothetical protein